MKKREKNFTFEAKGYLTREQRSNLSILKRTYGVSTSSLMREAVQLLIDKYKNKGVL